MEEGQTKGVTVLGRVGIWGTPRKQRVDFPRAGHVLSCWNRREDMFRDDVVGRTDPVKLALAGRLRRETPLPRRSYKPSFSCALTDVAVKQAIASADTPE